MFAADLVNLLEVYIETRVDFMRSLIHSTIVCAFSCGKFYPLYPRRNFSLLGGGLRHWHNVSETTALAG
jgi:hypothetical protein